MLRLTGRENWPWKFNRNSGRRRTGSDELTAQWEAEVLELEANRGKFSQGKGAAGIRLSRRDYAQRMRNGYSPAHGFLQGYRSAKFHQGG